MADTDTTAPVPEPENRQSPDAASLYVADGDTPAPADTPRPPAGKAEEAVTWTASEFIAHQKSAGWYGLLAAVALVVAAIIYLITRDPVATGFIIFGAIVLGYYASRQPREQPYRLDASGVSIGDKRYSYDDFRSFSVVPEGAFLSVVFMPLKRFAPLRAIYFAPDQKDRIIAMLTPRLPFEEYRHDAVDRLMNRIRF